MRFAGDPFYDALFAARLNFAATFSHTNRASGVTFDRTAIVQSVSVTRELSGDLPDSVSLIGGAVSARATVLADGAMPNAPHPLRSSDRSSWLGAAAVVSAGYESTLLPLFTGRIREIGFDDEARSRSIVLVDNSDRMRAPVTLIPFGSRASRTGARAVNRYPTNLSAVIVRALHDNGIRVTPEPRANCVISIPLAFGMLADIGWTVPNGAGIAAGVAWLEPGKFAPVPKQMTGPDSWNAAAFPSRQVFYSTGDLQVEHWYRHVPGVSGNIVTVKVGTILMAIYVDASSAFRYRYSTNNGQAWVDVGYNAARVLPAGWNQLAFQIDQSYFATLWLDGVQQDRSSIPLYWSGFVSIPFLVPGKVQSLNVYYSEGPRLVAPVSEAGFTPAADVDTALLELDALPPVENTVGWELCKEVAAAEFGMVGFSEAGRFYFRNRDSLNGPIAPVATWSTDLVSNLAGSATVDTVRTRVTSSVDRTWYVWSGRGASTPASTAVPAAILRDSIQVGPGANMSFLLRAAEAFMPEDAVVTEIAAIGEAWDVANGIVYCTEASGATRLATTSRASIHPVTPTTWRVEVTQLSAGTPYFPVWPAEFGPPTYPAPPFALDRGSPAMWVNGRRFASREEATDVAVNVVDPFAVADWGDRAFAMESSRWRQDAATVTALANRLLADLATPRAEIADITVPADLRWQIGDPVLVTDWQGRVPDVLARIVRMTTAVSLEQENGMTGTYSLRTLPA